MLKDSIMLNDTNMINSSVLILNFLMLRVQQKPETYPSYGYN